MDPASGFQRHCVARAAGLTSEGCPAIHVSGVSSGAVGRKPWRLLQRRQCEGGASKRPQDARPPWKRPARERLTELQGRGRGGLFFHLFPTALETSEE